MSHARYLLQGNDNHWRAVPLERYSAATRRSAPKVGVVELLAQNMTICYFDNEGQTQHARDIFVPPRYIQNNKGSTTYTAVNKGVPQFSIEALCDMCKSARFIMLSEFPDNHGGNRRKMFFAAEQLPGDCFHSGRMHGSSLPQDIRCPRRQLQVDARRPI